MDFLSLSEHNHMLTDKEMEELIQAAKRATGSGFVALFGQEFSPSEEVLSFDAFNCVITDVSGHAIAIMQTLTDR